MGWTIENAKKYRPIRNARRRERYALNIGGFRDKTKVRQKKEYANNKEYYKQKAREQYFKYRVACLNAYSNGTNSCACCGENLIEFLTLDHINGDGANHREMVSGRKRTAKYGMDLYHFLYARNFPDKDKLQVLCYNCNCAKRTDLVCPHQKLKNKEK